MKLSNQAIGAIMMALQKGIMEQTDVTQLLQEFEIVDAQEGLVVENPPVINIPEEPEASQEQATEASQEQA